MLTLPIVISIATLHKHDCGDESGADAILIMMFYHEQ